MEREQLVKKIGILTFHRAINYGAFMQAYALSNRLKKDIKNATIEIIDYATETSMNRYSTSIGDMIKSQSNIRDKAKILLKVITKPLYLAEKRKLNSAFESNYKFLPLSDEKLVTDDVRIATEWLENRYDIIVVGSDCVWETIGYPFPNIYFLNDLKNVIKISYAATVDRLFYKEIMPEKENYIKKALSDFVYLGVRDVSTELMLKKMSLNYQHNCDPTLLLDLKDIPVDFCRIDEIFNREGISDRHFVIGMMGQNQYCKAIKRRYGDQCKIVSLYGNYEDTDLYIEDLSPVEWAHIFSKFNLTISTLFHGSLLSLVNGTPTIAMDNWTSYNGQLPSKIKDVYSRLGLLNHYICCEHGFGAYERERLIEMIEKFRDEPETDSIKKAIEKERASYDSFLSQLEKMI